MMTVAATIYSRILDLYTDISELAAAYPGWFSTISGGAILGVLWAYWKRPIINVRFGKKEGSHAPVTVALKNPQGEIFRVPAKYFRVRIRNAGLTTIKACSGQLIKVTRRVVGKAPDIFGGDECHLGSAHYSQNDTRDIPRGVSFQMDIATLVLGSNGNQLFVGGLGRTIPTTLFDFLNSWSGKATYTLDVLIAADNATPRKVPIEVAFDPEQTELSYVPLNTRYPWWRLWWWLRAQWSRRMSTR
jgi:hypothetical protein